MVISRLPSGSGKGELHGASILVSVEDDGLIGQTVELFYEDVLVKSGEISGEKSFLFTNLLDAGNYTATIGEATSKTVVTAENIINKETITVTISLGIQLTVGNTYCFGGFDWTCAEDKDGYYVLQSQGVSNGAYPGYTMSGNLTNASGNTIDVGNANTNYNGDIDGYDIHAVNSIMSDLYNEISFAEKTDAIYGKGLFLVSNAMAGQTTPEQPGSGNYWSALQIAATNSFYFNANAPDARTGTVAGSYTWQVNQNGNLYNNGLQSFLCVLAPAFNLDKSKVKLVGYNDIVALDAPERLYLYDEGDEHNATTGEWTGGQFVGGTLYTIGDSYIKRQSKYIELVSGTTSNTNIAMIPNNLINLTEYSSLKVMIKYWSGNDNTSNLMLLTTPTKEERGTKDAYITYNSTTQKRRIVSLDVSGVNKESSPKVNTYNMTIHVQKIWLEK